MNELYKDMAIVVSITVLLSGAYLVYDAVSNPKLDSPGSLIIGAGLCSLGLVMGHSSARLAYSIYQWKRHPRNSDDDTTPHNP